MSGLRADGRRGALAALGAIPLWMIPAVYVVISTFAALVVPRLEHAYLAGYAHGIAVGSALAFFSAVASGMMSFTGIVFAIAFLVVQFSATAYSPRLVVTFAANPTLYHTLGVFFATFTYSLAALVWTDRGGSGAAPVLSTAIVALLLFVSLLAFSQLVLSVNNLQINNVLQTVGRRGRAVIREMAPLSDGADLTADAGSRFDPGPVTQTLAYAGEPKVVSGLDLEALAQLARGADAVVAVECAVGETLIEGAVLLRVHAGREIAEPSLRRAVRLAPTRTFERDPKYALRLLVDVAIRALSPAVNDPTTAVQALDQIEDLMCRLGRSRLGSRPMRDAAGAVRVTYPAPTWEDYLALSFDEIRQFGATSLQVDRRLRAALVGLIGALEVESRRDAVRRYLAHLDEGARRSPFDEQDRVSALQLDREGLGLSRGPAPPEPEVK
ncbi:MAG TPA: DUF2254 domain-containing protein [Caulobacteraceae bacterium]|nr:DUF2254 domain-containing protein [Caulobacteraceae bacterium]